MILLYYITFKNNKSSGKKYNNNFVSIMNRT